MDSKLSGKSRDYCLQIWKYPMFRCNTILVLSVQIRIVDCRYEIFYVFRSKTILNWPKVCFFSVFFDQAEDYKSKRVDKENLSFS